MIKMVKASELVKQEKLDDFAKLVLDGYSLTSDIVRDYPQHFEHYWSKYVPGVIEGTREIIAEYCGSVISGIIILKNESGECKICTLLVRDEYRHMGIGTRLLEEGFKWLGTSRPLITLADFKLEQFSSIIAKYHWQITDMLELGYYNNHSRELVFNGPIKTVNSEFVDDDPDWT